MLQRQNNSFSIPSRLLVWLLAVSSVALSSCGAAKPKRPVVPVTGHLFVQGKPATGAMVILRPVAGSDGADDWITGFPRATVRGDGSFQVGTNGEADGAPVGDYIVLVQWDENAAPNESESSEAKFVDRLGGRYSDPARATLRVTVAAPKTTMPKFDLD